MLSVLLCIKNEAEHLPACLDSLAFADEIEGSLEDFPLIVSMTFGV